ncbi:FHA domain-containing protein [Neorhodopirellula lusitana]|uniref:FHA domain-containing protein n=1 Tax=Neorhodopirellula lusitana TaxID=445327 RepID=UPI00384F60D7
MTDSVVDVLHRVIVSQMGAEATAEEIRRQVDSLAASQGLPDETVALLLERFAIRSDSTLVDVSDDEQRVPRLLVEWGELPRVGYQVRPEFSLLCPAELARPDVSVSVDSQLDHDPSDPLRTPSSDESGLWSFYVPFRMTTQSESCLPGQYLLTVDVYFPDASPGVPRFYRTGIRLNIDAQNDGQGGVLEIDGDGQSIVNLQGYSLKQFSKVVLKGSQDSVVNLQSSLAPVKHPDHETETKPRTSFEYQLKVDAEKQSRIPTVISSGKARYQADAACFCFDAGMRSMVFAKPRLNFGRSRDNDVVLRFLPRSEELDQHSRNVSRTHFTVELAPEGIRLEDKSSSGVEVGGTVVLQEAMIPTDHVGEVTPIQLGISGDIPRPFQMNMTTLGPGHYVETSNADFWNRVSCDFVGAHPSRLSRQAVEQKLDAVRFDRLNNLADDESYLWLFRETFVGGATNQCGIVIPNTSIPQLARLFYLDRSFWLEPLTDPSRIQVDGKLIEPGTWVPLEPGMRVSFGGWESTFALPGQLYLD